MNKPISVIIPVKNGTNYLREAIESLRSQGMDLEIIVVDDASDDGTADLARELGCTVLQHDVCRGQIAGKNTGVSAANGRYVMFMDHDDIMRPGTLKVLYDTLESSPDIAAVMAKVQDFLSPDVEAMPGLLIRPDAYHGLFTGAVLIRKSALDAVGPFGENRRTGEIIEWQTKMDANHLPIQKIDLVASDRRIHRTNFGRTDAKTEYQNYASVLRERLKALKK